jgi:hypothetical protein
MLERSVLFSAPEGAYVTHRVPSIVCAPGGAVIAAVESRRPGENTDWTRNGFQSLGSLALSAADGC